MKNRTKNILITGGAGFIGSSLVDKLLGNPNIRITCIDNLDPFYDPKIKKSNILNHLKKTNYTFIKADICNLNHLESKLSKHYDAIIHLAARVGVQPSLRDPLSYTRVNVNGTQNMLELARKLHCKKFIFTSSSSIYGVNPNVPWAEHDLNYLPISSYAATKISAELIGHVYSHLYHFQFIALRLFTVYGPRMRPDLAIHKFANLIWEGKPITMYGNGETKRDYTYIDDIISGIMGALDYSRSQYELINLGNNKPIKLRKLILLLEEVLGKKATIKNLPQQSGDVPLTFADIRKAKKLLGYTPKTDLPTGLQNFTDWFKKRHEE